MEFGSFHAGHDGEYSGVSLVKISEIFTMPETFYFGTESFDRVEFLSNGLYKLFTL